MKQLCLLLALALTITACDKDGLQPSDCDKLETAMATDNKPVVKAMVEKAIEGLDSQNYNEANLNKLLSSLNTCKVMAEMPCYDCIKTDPSQTELSFRIQYNGNTLIKHMDLSYTSTGKIRYVNIHD